MLQGKVGGAYVGLGDAFGNSQNWDILTSF